MQQHQVHQTFHFGLVLAAQPPVERVDPSFQKLTVLRRVGELLGDSVPEFLIALVMESIRSSDFSRHSLVERDMRPDSETLHDDSNSSF